MGQAPALSARINEEEKSMNKTDYAAYARHFSVEELTRKLSENKGIGRTVLKKIYELWYVLKSPATPTWAKALIVGALGYFILPLDAVADLIPGLGFVDDIGVLASTLATVATFVTDDVKAKANEAVENLQK